MFHLLKVDHESVRCFVYTGMDIHFETFIPYISVFILFYVDLLFFLLAQLTKTQKEKTKKENMIARMAKEKGKIDSDHNFFIYCNL